MFETIKKHDPETWNSPKMCEFFANAIDHRFGYFHYSSKPALGNRAGGFCGNVDFKVTPKSVYFDDSYYECTDVFVPHNFSLRCAKAFPEEFEKFESQFFKFVEEQYGPDALK